MQHFGALPFVFLLDEIKNGLATLLRDLEVFLSATAPAPEEVVSTARNAGVNYYQAQILRRLNRFHRSELNPAGRFNLNNRYARALKMDPRRFCQYWLGFLPNKGLLVSEKHRQMMIDFYREDWNYVLSCTSNRLR